ncbi:DUF4822 domain-containing protein [Providencia stuartii]|uniref:DUF4822 domain-containing protein n=2 Tax=Providencia TaxID=586 RepID=A0A1S1HS87_PROST|nr:MULTISPECIES: DUF4822 domain-containing protein [Providencia]MDV5226006.1 DUF4822 domain-containing protein [Providencia rettgeri]ELR5111670.1 DUF4822 domain-containing protein [Providencia stuartii]ELR5299140.1 DUF4822 domain-containing protein [Providencia stuartii]MDW7587406.1 DUF4822 domain-containing protein [Providencia sp. 2023EL-00965]MDX4947210.1 DUF4822 domain-containing protein [Providencia manganoxydans]
MKLKPLIAAIITLSSVTAFAATTQANSATVTGSAVVANANAEKPLNAYENMMIDKVWVTTEALDQDNKKVDPANEQVANFFGLAEYYPNGSFKMTTLDGKPKMQGEWSFSDDGKSRSLTAKDDKGEVLFTRVVENVTVSPDEYTYRIYPTQDDKSKYVDIVHKVKK